MSGRLLFPLDAVAAQIEHALTSPDHSDSFADQEAGNRTGPALVWFKDTGTGVMSNGTPDRSEPVYAHYNEMILRDVQVRDVGEEMWTLIWDTTREVCGGDDFAEFLDIDTLGGIQGVRDAITDGAHWLFIDVSETTIDIGFLEAA